MFRLYMKRIGFGVMLGGNVGTRHYAVALTRECAWVFDTYALGAIVRMGPLAAWTWR